MGWIKDTADRVRQFGKNTYDAWRNRERKPKKLDPPHVTVMAWQVRSAHVLSWLAAGIASYFLWSFCVGIAGDQSNALHLTHAGTWIGDIQFYFPLIVGFVGIAFTVPYLGKSIIPIFVALNWREHFWPKLWTLILCVSASFVIIAGSFSVQGGAIIEHGRGAAVATEQVMTQHATLEAQIDAEQHDLDSMMTNPNAYMAQAANVGEAEWQRTYIPQARTTRDPRLPMIERALGAARAADARRARLIALRAQLASSATVASVTATPVTSGTSWIASTIDFIRGAWALMLSVLNDIVCLLMGWIALRLEQTRNRQLGDSISGSGWADEAHRIEDKRHEEPIAKNPAKMQTQLRVFNNDTGEEEVHITPKPYWRAVRKGRKTKVEIPGEDPGPIDKPAATGTGDERGALWAPSATVQGAVDPINGGQDADIGDDEVERKEENVGDSDSATAHFEPAPLSDAIELPDLTEDELAAEEANDDTAAPNADHTEESNSADDLGDSQPVFPDHVGSDAATHEASTALTPPGYFDEETAARRRRAYEQELELSK